MIKVAADVVTIGAGPAGLAASIYLARANYTVEVLEKDLVGGALNEITKLENYPGFLGSGFELAQKMRAQAEAVGVKFTELDDVLSEEDIKNKFGSRAVLIATGSEPKKLALKTDVPVSYCVACDGSLYKDKNVVVVGGGNSAVQESIHLSKIVKNLKLISHSPLRAEKNLIIRLKKCENVKIITGREVSLRDLDAIDGIFALIGKCPATNFCPKEILNDCGYIETNEDYMTKIPGIFAAGDVRKGSVKQVATAVGEGAAAALQIVDFLTK